MRRLLIFILFLISFELYGQQDPQISHYFFMKSFYNPAVVGTQEEICANLIPHQQWKKFENAPFTTILSLDGPINLFGLDNGIGVNFVDDRYGFVRDFRANISLASNFDIGFGNLSIGVSPGIFSQKFNPEWKFPDQTESILTGEISATVFDMGLGLYYSVGDLFLGLSTFHLLRPKLNFIPKGGGDASSVFLVNHFFLTTGYNFQIPNTAIELIPSVFVKTDLTSLQYDINIFALYNKKIWVSVTYRNKDALAFLVGTSYFNNIKLGLSYDVTLSYINRVSQGTLEAYVGYCFSFIKVDNAQSYRNVKTL
jgi:type IX secretion system PorP/SprF family membrane protein